MMSPAATSTAAPAKSGEFDTATLFVADKSARDEAALALASAAKKHGVEFFGSIGLNDALVKVSPGKVAW
jgi:elongation factor 3